MKIIRERKFANGTVYALETHDGYPIEVTDTFLPYYTKDAAWCHHNRVIEDGNFGSRAERWMIGVSVMSGCPVGCKFCATGSLKRWRNITAEEIAEQVAFVVFKNTQVNAMDSREFKINYTRMGEPFLNVDGVRGAVEIIERGRPGTHHYISTIGVKGSDFSWIRDNMTLQLSLHSLDDARRDALIPFRGKMSVEELSRIRVASKNKITLISRWLEKKTSTWNAFGRYSTLTCSSSSYHRLTATPYPTPTAWALAMFGRQNLFRKGCDVDAIAKQLSDAGYEFAVATATEAEITAGAACGQLSIIVGD